MAESSSNLLLKMLKMLKMANGYHAREGTMFPVNAEPDGSGHQVELFISSN